MHTYHIWTVGCQMNKADSERLGRELAAIGYHETDQMGKADVIVINSCSVRQSAENKVASRLGTLRSLKRDKPGVLVTLMGCMVGQDTSELQHRFPQVDLFLPPQAFDELIERLSAHRQPPTEEASPADGSTVSRFVNIMHGCDNFCTYCIVPYRRGRERSRPIDEIICEVEGLMASGAKEIVFLGQNVDSYGKTLPEHPDLADLLRETNAVRGLLRIRFLTSHPRDMSDRLVRAVAELDKVCEYINLPVQAGDDGVLKAMRRGYTVDDYRALVGRIRAAMPEVGLTTDVIVGFPGERPEQFEGTRALLEELRFDAVHVAAYSPRPGTIAARMADDVPLEEKDRRLQVVERLQGAIALEQNQELVGRRVEILVEGQAGGKWQGRTRGNKLAFFRSEIDYLGQLVSLRITSASAWSLQGTTDESSGSQEDSISARNVS